MTIPHRFYCNHFTQINNYTLSLECELEYLSEPEDLASTSGFVIVDNQKGKNLTFEFNLFMWVNNGALCWDYDTDCCSVTDWRGCEVSREYVEAFFAGLRQPDALLNFEAYIFNDLINKLMRQHGDEFKDFIIEKQLESNE